MELTSLQLSAVKEILSLYDPNKKVVCEFKAPTGSGKTLMASRFISDMILNNQNDKFIFVIATPSSSSLPQFFEEKLNKYKIDLPYSKFDVEYVKSPSSTKADKSESIPKIIAEKNKVYIFGKASFGKSRIFSQYGVIDDFVKFSIYRGYKLIYIRDEAHIGGEKINKKDTEDFENLMISNASFILKMTATPNMKDLSTQKVFLSEKDLNDESKNDGKFLLKTEPKYLLNKSMEISELLDSAIEKYKEIKNEYESLNINIHPAMLIQVSNDSNTNEITSEKFNENLKNIQNILDNNGLKWVKYFGDGEKDSNRVFKGNFSLSEITENNDPTDVIIFKIGPATGWDIPRACMLVQLRNISSKTLNAQTIGRIKRNPYPNLERNSITDKYYIYSNEFDDNNFDDLYVFNYKVQEDFKKEKFLYITISNKKNIDESYSKSDISKKIKNWLIDNKNKISQIMSLYFIDNNTKYKKVISDMNGNEIYMFITDPFIFLRDYKKLVESNKALFNLIKNAVEEFCKDKKLQQEFVFTILLTYFNKDLKDEITQLNIFKPKYEIREVEYKHNSYIEIFDKNNVEIEKIATIKEYLFNVVSNNEDNNDRQPLDSKPELCVFNKIDNFISKSKNNGEIKIWAKNLVNSSIYGEYLDNINSVKHSYFDFILKFENGFCLYIEVKGNDKNDIDKEKTKLLKDSYKYYFKGSDLFKQKLIICVWEVGDNKQITSSVFYDNYFIKEDLNGLSYEGLLKKISELN